MFQLFDEPQGDSAASGDATSVFDSCGLTSTGRQPVLQGQQKVLAFWRTMKGARRWAQRTEIDFSHFPRELAHLSLLALSPTGMKFRLAGGGLKMVFGREARGLDINDISACRQSTAWTAGAEQAISDLAPMYGETRMPCGGVHFWLRLPLSSDGRNADLVLCHDRYLASDAIENPECAARAADEALQRDLFEPAAA
jgi:hypothetical protein